VRTGALVCILIGFLGVLAAYVALTLAGQDATGLVSVVVTLLGVTGLGAHIEARTQQQNRTIAKIDKQTNGVLDRRIHDGTKAAVAQLLAEHEATVVVPVPAKPAKPRKRAASATP
jgi:hypothetical protein